MTFIYSGNEPIGALIVFNVPIDYSRMSFWQIVSNVVKRVDLRGKAPNSSIVFRRGGKGNKGGRTYFGAKLKSQGTRVHWRAGSSTCDVMMDMMEAFEKRR